jgi:hypothetical protein
MTKFSCILFPIAFAFATSVSVKDFKPAYGKWTGTITYLDYTSGKPFAMPANVKISKNNKDAQQLIFAFEYPQEPKANGNDTLVISQDGMMIDDTKVVSKESKDGGLQIISEKDGVDGNENKKALIRYIYRISKKSFVKRKEVKFDGKDKFILRNEFKMSR